MLETPEKIRELQRKLYRKTKQEPGYRFYLLYDKAYRREARGGKIAESSKLIAQRERNGKGMGQEISLKVKAERGGKEKGARQEVRDQKIMANSLKQGGPTLLPIFKQLLSSTLHFG